MGPSMTDATPIDLLRGWVVRKVPQAAARWFEQQVIALAAATSEKDLYLALGYAIRRLGKADLGLSPHDLAAARAARAGWNPSDWSVDQAARLVFILATDDGGAAPFKARL